MKMIMPATAVLILGIYYAVFVLQHETEEQRIARVVARDNPHLVPDPLIHPDINKQWIIQYNRTTKKYRAFWLFTHSELYGEYDTREEAAKHLNEIHLKNKAGSAWEAAP